MNQLSVVSYQLSVNSHAIALYPNERSLFSICQTELNQYNGLNQHFVLKS
ncbi:hypothetical protein MICAE_160006 [Microcystis aeruginosa PCC 9806]|uniref:Uncharacterized protein n=1 Tax=Microcystis aeruginosa PCC 9806 TaxID=1160282 RepID=I4GTA0_MICAE|nr:hypothetical protein [Microcystis aeruginosa]CCI13024.1 hypothetical protein MICAE_160006 [Microcystis aeruginosa PCC 9806]